MRILASEARRISDNSQHPKFDDYTDDPTLGVKFIDQEIFFVYRKGACE
jgi:hypothetical protein